MHMCMPAIECACTVCVCICVRVCVHVYREERRVTPTVKETTHQLYTDINIVFNALPWDTFTLKIILKNYSLKGNKNECN